MIEITCEEIGKLSDEQIKELTEKIIKEREQLLKVREYERKRFNEIFNLEK
jgi:hypothetical protein